MTVAVIFASVLALVVSVWANLETLRFIRREQELEKERRNG